MSLSLSGRVLWNLNQVNPPEDPTRAIERSREEKKARLTKPANPVEAPGVFYSPRPPYGQSEIGSVSAFSERSSSNPSTARTVTDVRLAPSDGAGRPGEYRPGVDVGRFVDAFLAQYGPENVPVGQLPHAT